MGIKVKRNMSLPTSKLEIYKPAKEVKVANKIKKVKSETEKKLEKSV